MRTLINQKALNFLKHYSAPVLNYTLISHPRELTRCKTPFVLKVDAPNILHKRERNLVRFVYNLSEAEKHWHAIRKHGHVIKQEYSEGHNIIIQIVRGAGIKPTVLLGLGGVSIDFHKDFVESTCPISKDSARNMLRQLNVYNYINIYNGKPTKLIYLENTLVKLSELAVKEPDLIALEIDPFILNHRSGKIIDAKIILE